jgi:superoxide dismutase, Cu-Zn family
MTGFRLALSITAAGLLATGCAMHGGDGHQGMMMGGPMAMATLSPTAGNSVQGKVMFHEMDGHLMVHAMLSGLAPGSEHGFHLHDKGDCSAPDGSSAGGHFNPDAKPHGPQDGTHHVGDMPSLKADANGKVDLHASLMGPTVSAGPASIVGRGVIVHAGADDFVTQPTGNSGARIACGVVAAR